MAGLAYLLPPVTGLWAFMRGPDARTRAHGFQSVLLGVAWPAAMYVGSWITPGATQAIFIAFALTWLVLLVTAATGRGLVAGGLVGRIEEGDVKGEG